MGFPFGYPNVDCGCGCGASHPCTSNPAHVNVSVSGPCSSSSKAGITFTVYDGSGNVVGTMTTGSGGTATLAVTSLISGGRIGLTGGLPCNAVQPADQSPVTITSCGQSVDFTFTLPLASGYSCCCPSRCTPMPATLNATFNGATGTLSLTNASTGAYSGVITVPGVTAWVYTDSACHIASTTSDVPLLVTISSCNAFRVTAPVLVPPGIVNPSGSCNPIAANVTVSGGAFVYPSSPAPGCVQSGALLDTGAFTLSCSPYAGSSTGSGATACPSTTCTGSTFQDPMCQLFGTNAASFSVSE